MEVSSFMLLEPPNSPAHCRVNEYFANHLDYHKTRENYVRAKMRITQTKRLTTICGQLWFGRTGWFEQAVSRQSGPIFTVAKTKDGAYELDGTLYYKENHYGCGRR